MQNNTFEEIWNKIKNSESFLISLHANPDGDSLGSCTAMKYVLEKLGKKVRVVSGDEIDDALMSNEAAKEVEFGKDISEVNLKEFDVLMCLDTGTPNLIGSSKEDISFLKEIFVINIDHHKTNNYYGGLNYRGDDTYYRGLNYVDGDAPSTCSVLVEFLKDRVEWDKKLAERLMIGIATDTGFLGNSGNLKRAFEELNFLSKYGDYVETVVEKIIFNQPLKMKKFEAYLINNLKINKEKRFGYVLIPLNIINKLGLNVSEVRLGIKTLRTINGMDVVFTIAETEKGIKGSFRSKKGIDVSKMAYELGGGGHKAAAAFRTTGSLEDVEKKTLEVVSKFLSK